MRLVPGKALGGHIYLVQRPAFSPDGARFVAGDLRGGLIVRERSGDIVAKTRVPSTRPHSTTGEVHAVAWSPCGTRVAVHVDDGVSLRRPDDLSTEAATPSLGTGPIAFGGDGRWLAAIHGSRLLVRGVPSFDDLGAHNLRRGLFDCFDCTEVVADPHGSLIAVADDGGLSETAFGTTTNQGAPKVTLVDVERNRIIAVINPGVAPGIVSIGVELDPWRGQIIIAAAGYVSMWSRGGELLRRFAPYERGPAQIAGYGGGPAQIAVSERWLATVPETGYRSPSRMDLWDPMTLQHLAGVELGLDSVPRWIAASPDGGVLLTPGSTAELPIRMWTVE